MTHSHQKHVDRLRRRADGLERRASAKETHLPDHVRLTPKRAADASSRAADARALRDRQQALRLIADGLEAGTLPPLLTGVRDPDLVAALARPLQDRAAVHVSVDELARLRAAFPDEPLIDELAACPLMYGCSHRLTPALTQALDSLPVDWAAALSTDRPWMACLNPQLTEWRRYRDAGLGDPDAAEQAAQALHVLMRDGADPDAARRLKLDALERDLVGLRLPGFYPTPPTLAATLAELADLHPGLRVLEPQAGTGSLADALVAREPRVQLQVCERSATLREILTVKGYDVIGDDSAALRGRWDRVVMNPPFGNLVDIDHVRHAARLVRPGGLLVAVVSESAFFRSERRAQDFRAWLDAQGATVLRNDAGAFSHSRTGHDAHVHTRTVRLHVPQ